MTLFHWLEKAGFDFDPDGFLRGDSTDYMSARNGQLEALKYLHANGGDLAGHDPYEPDVGCCYWAVQSGHLDAVKFLHRKGCARNSYIVDVAVDRGEIEILNYLLTNDCAADSDAFAIADSRGNLVELKLLRSFDCCWDMLLHLAIGIFLNGHLTMDVPLRNHHVNMRLVMDS